MPRTPTSRRIWIVAVIGGVVVDLTFAFRQFWLQPRADSGDLARWLDFSLDLASYGLLLAAVYLPTKAAMRVSSPAAFLVMPGRFVAPPAPWPRMITTQAAVAAWAALPVFLLGWQIAAPGGSPWVPGAGWLLLGLPATVLAWRSWRRTVTLTPEGLSVREIWDTEVVLPWDRAASELVADPRSLRWIDARFLARAVDHYWADPTHRAAIGTPEEHLRLTELLADPAPAAPSAQDG